jgi:hypothetical protein
MNKQSKKIWGIFSRYLALIILGLGNLYIIYKILTPLTILVTNGILSIFTKTSLIDNMIRMADMSIEIVPACVAGSAFYLLLLLIVSMADVKPVVRTKMIITALITLFLLNITRILILVPFARTTYFDTIHWIFWHIISTVFVVGIWVMIVRIYKTKSIPIYSDVKYIAGLTKAKKPKRKKKNK